ncbi:MAG: GumC family protein [Xanthobacteraceae bacterium]
MFEAPREVRSAAIASRELPAAPAPPPQIELLKICSVLWRGWTTILCTTVVCLLLAVLLALIVPHRYTAVTEILIDPADLRGVANDPSPSTQASDTALLVVDSQVRVLTSDDVLRRVVDSQKLAQDPEFVGRPSVLHRLAAPVLALFGRRDKVATGDPSLAALDALRRHTRVTRAERTYVVDVAVSSERAEKAARLANAIGQAYLVEQTVVRADAARQVSQSLSGRLSALRESVHQAEERVQQFKTSHNIVDANGHLVNEQQLSDLNNQLAAARARTAAAKARLDEIQAVQKSKLDIGAFPAAVQSQTISALRSQYAEIMRVEAQQTTSLGARHPAVIEIQAQAERIRRMINDEVNRIALAARADYRSAKAGEDLLHRNVDALKQNTLATDAALVNLRELQREVQASRAVYEAFLMRARETGAQEQVDTKNIQVISRADVPLNRTSPPPNTILALGAIFIGIAAGSGLVLLREAAPGAIPQWPGRASPRRFFGRKAKPAPPAELPPGIPVLAKVPAITAAFGPDTMDEPNSRFAAGIRKVYDTVRARRHNGDNPSILIVAADDDEDTAAVALTLAALAASTERVLLIDADLERRTLSAIDADRTEAGLVDVAVGRRMLADAVVCDRHTNINLIPFVSPKSRRDRQINEDDVRGAFAQTRQFDVVIVAAMDLNCDPSGRFFAGLVDHIVLVIKAEAAGRVGLDDIVSRLGFDARKVRGAVVTEAKEA